MSRLRGTPITRSTMSELLFVAYWRKKDRPRDRWTRTDHFAWEEDQESKLAFLRKDQGYIDWKMVPYKRVRS